MDVGLALRPTISAEARSTADGATHATRQRTNGDGIDCGAGFAGPLLFRPAALSKRRNKQGASDDLRRRTQETRPLQASGGQRVASRPATSGRASEGRRGASRRRDRPATRLELRSALPGTAPDRFSARDTRGIAFSRFSSAAVHPFGLRLKIVVSPVRVRVSNWAELPAAKPVQGKTSVTGKSSLASCRSRVGRPKWTKPDSRPPAGIGPDLTPASGSEGRSRRRVILTAGIRPRQASGSRPSARLLLGTMQLPGVCLAGPGCARGRG